MNRSSLALLAALALAACTFKPDGTCSTAADCFAGQSCTAGLCVGCQADAECQGWQSCNVAQRRCVAVPGKCPNDQACQAWQLCDDTFTCALRPGSCDAGVGCQAWQACVNHACTLPAGRCDTVADCGAAQICTAEHRCVSGCPTGNECQAWEACGADQTCALQPGRCLATIDCAAWQTCDVPSHTCGLTPGKCDLGVGCHAWEDCTVHDCVLQAGRCNAAGDCAAWQTCDGTNTCALAPGRCGTAADCADWQTCSGAYTCIPQPGRCATEADCPGWEVCSAANTCEALQTAAERVYYGGILRTALTWTPVAQGIADPYTPTRPLISVPAFGTSRAWIDPSGRMIYVAGVWNTNTFSWNYQIKRAVWDTLILDGGSWTSAGGTNDVVLKSVTDLREFVLQEGTGAILHDDGGSTWTDLDGNVRFAGSRVLSWSRADVLLALDWGVAPRKLKLVDPAGVVTVVTGLEFSVFPVTLSARVHGDGFWLLVGQTWNSALERWLISADGTATLDVTYPLPTPTARLQNLSQSLDAGAVLDASGSAWALYWESDADQNASVYRLDASPGAATVVVPDPPRPGSATTNDLIRFLITGEATVSHGFVTGP